MATPTTYWLVAAQKAGMQKSTDTLQKLNSMICQFSEAAPKEFGILAEATGLDTLKFGAFDNLIRLTDDLAKSDSQIEGSLRRIERQLLELDPEVRFTIMSQKQQYTIHEYLTQWKWDNGKFDRSRQISENCSLLMGVVGKMDEEVRSKASLYNETKTALGNMKEKDGANLVSKDLVDVLTPETVKPDDFIYETHLTTVVVVVPKGGQEELEKCYETLADEVVPRSAKKIHGEDKEGNTLWRIVMFKTAVETFRKASREKRFVVRDFEYCSDGFENMKAQRAKYEEDLKKHFTGLTNLCKAAFSDVFVGWIHIKAMRVFVESTLRFGIPPVFNSYIIMPNANGLPKVREALDRLFTAPSKNNSQYGGKMLQAAAEAEGEEYFPYVSFAFTPLSGKM